jgi:hypothetical protein
MPSSYLWKSVRDSEPEYGAVSDAERARATRRRWPVAFFQVELTSLFWEYDYDCSVFILSIAEIKIFLVVGKK